MLHSQRTMGLVAKHEIARWPLVGWMAAARRHHLPSPRQHRIAGWRAARDARAAARGTFGRRVSRRPHPRRPRGRAVPCADLPGRGRGRRAGAAGGAALRRAGRRADRGRVPAGRAFLRQFPAPAGRAGAAGGGAFPGTDRRRAKPTAAAASPNWRASASSRRWKAELRNGESRSRCQHLSIVVCTSMRSPRRLPSRFRIRSTPATTSRPGGCATRTCNRRWRRARCAATSARARSQPPAR